jgi:hypothetical protein
MSGKILCSYISLNSEVFFVKEKPDVFVADPFKSTVF